MKKALLVIDIQEALSLQHDQELNHNINAINDIIHTYSKEDVFYIRHVEVGSEFDLSKQTSELHSLLHIVNQQVILKYHHSAFYQTELHQTLKEKGISTIDICGYQIEYCVDATIKTGHFLGYQVRILRDHIHTFDTHTLSKQTIKNHYLDQFMLYGELI